MGTTAGPDAGGEKDGPEEEEEEDFDDLTQDEEDEMSSASEESVLSVPELQVRVGRPRTIVGSGTRAGYGQAACLLAAPEVVLKSFSTFECVMGHSSGLR